MAVPLGSALLNIFKTLSLKNCNSKTLNKHIHLVIIRDFQREKFSLLIFVQLNNEVNKKYFNAKSSAEILKRGFV